MKTNEIKTIGFCSNKSTKLKRRRYESDHDFTFKLKQATGSDQIFIFEKLIAVQLLKVFERMNQKLYLPSIKGVAR